MFFSPGCLVGILDSLEWKILMDITPKLGDRILMCLLLLSVFIFRTFPSIRGIILFFTRTLVGFKFAVELLERMIAVG
jgi:hypothetical protein